MKKIILFTVVLAHCIVQSLAQSCSITDLKFTDLNALNPIAITSGTSYNLTALPSQFTLDAGTTGTVGSVKFTVTGAGSASNIENAAPYNAPGTGSAWALGTGTFTVVIEAYSMTGATGTICSTKTYTFTIVDNCTNCTGNVIQNPSFESGTTSWNWGGGTLNQGGGAVKCGTYSGDFLPSSNDNYVSQTIGTDLAVGTKVDARVYAGVHDNTAKSVVGISFFDANWTYLSQSKQVEVDKILANSPVGPELYTISALVPAGAKYTQVVFSSFGSTGVWIKTDSWCATLTAPCTPPVVSITGNNLICTGASTTLTATAGSAYEWTINTDGTEVAAGSTQSITVSPTNSARYSVKVTNAAGCSAIAQKVVYHKSCTCPDNLLVNGSFETGLAVPNGTGDQDIVPASGWTGGLATSQPYINTNIIPDGTGFGYTNSTNNGKLTQDVLARPGSVYTLKFYATEHVSQGQTVTLQYLDANGTPIGTAASFTINAVYPAWTALTTLSLPVAPYEADKVRVSANSTGTNGANVAKIDGVCLTSSCTTWSNANNVTICSGSAIPSLTFNSSPAYSGYVEWCAYSQKLPAGQNPYENISNKLFCFTQEFYSANPTTSVSASNLTGLPANTTNAPITYFIYACIKPINPNCLSSWIMHEVTVNPVSNAGADGNTTVCNNSTSVINLNDLITGEQTGGTWTKLTGTGGTFVATSASFTPTGSTNSTFKYTVTGLAPCLLDESIATVNINTAPTAPIIGTITPPTCTVATGSVVINILPTGTYTLTRSGTSSLSTVGSTTSLTINGLAPGMYTYTVTAANTCTSPSSVSFEIPAQPVTPTAPTFGTVTQPTCTVATGSVVVNGLPTTGTWSLARSGTSSATTTGTGASTTISGLTPGTYTFTVTNAVSCVSPASVSVTINTQPLTPTAPTFGTVTQPTCTVATGSVVVNGLPTTGTWSLARSGTSSATTTGTGASTTISGLTPGTYTFTVTNSVSCVSPASVSVTINTQPVTPTAPTALVTQPTCSLATGALSISGLPAGNWTLNRTGTSSAIITGNGTTFSVSPIVAGTYNFTVTNADGCTSPALVGVVVNAQPATPIAPIVSVAQPNCAGQTGTATITSPVGQTYSMDQNTTFTSTLVYASLAAGSTHSFYVKNTAGCISSPTTITIDNPTALSLLINSKVDVACFGANTGSIDLGVTGGSPTYTYAWNKIGSTTIVSTIQDPTGLAAGTYSVIVTDSKGCTGTLNATISQPPAALSASLVSKIDVACFNGSTGAIDVNATGGTANYTYSWTKTGSPAFTASTADLNSLSAGAYNLTVTDANGCQATLVVTITQPSEALSLMKSSTIVSCNGGNDGTISLTATGGTPGYTYAWTKGGVAVGNTANLTNLSAGTFTVLVTDLKGCTETTSVVVTEPELLVLSVLGVDVPCSGGNNGSVDLTVSGGTAPFTYSWTKVGSSVVISNMQDLNSLTAGTYTVIVTDSKGCTKNMSAVISQNSGIELSGIVKDVKCFGESNGEIDINVTGGVAPYTYDWGSGFQSTIIDRTGLAPGSYSVIVKDAISGNCTTTKSFVVNQPQVLATSIVKTDITCNGGNAGAIDMTINGGTSPFVVEWKKGATVVGNTEDLTGLKAGTYDFTITDKNGCIKTGSVTLTEPFAGSIGDLTFIDANANGLQDLGEIGVDGISVKLYNANANGTPIGTEIASTTTAGGGLYNFPNVCAGNYVIEFGTKSGLVRTKQSNSASKDATDSDANPITGFTGLIILAAGENDPSNDAGFYKPASLGDFVWEDKNANGIQDAGEPGIKGVLVTLSNGATTTTGDNGEYSFASLVPGDYSVTFTKPTGYTPSPANVGDDTKDSDANTTTGTTQTVTLASGDNNPTLDAGFYKPASIGNYVWYDVNQNGIQDNLLDPKTGAVIGPELPVKGARIILSKANGDFVASQLTDDQGKYLFTGLVPGDYYVSFDPTTYPNGNYVITTPNVGDDNTDSDIEKVSYRAISTNLTSGEEDLSWDLGIYRSNDPKITDPCECLREYIYLPGNSNYIYSERVEVNSTPGTTWVIVAENPNNTAQKTFGIMQDGPSADFVPLPYNPVGDFLTLTANPEIHEYKFYHEEGTGYGIVVFNGRDYLFIGNSCTSIKEKYDARLSELCATASPITLQSLFPNIGTATYYFSANTPFEFKPDINENDIRLAALANGPITQLNPANYTPGSTISLFVDWQPIGNPAIKGTTCPKSLFVNVKISNDGTKCYAAIGDYVFEDVDKNDLQSTGDLPIKGVTVTLLDVNGNKVNTDGKGAPILPLLTDDNGKYLFSNLLPGTYFIEFGVKDQYVRVKPNVGMNPAIDSDASLINGKTSGYVLAAGDINLTADAGYAKVTALSVDLLSFEGKNIDSKSVLNWKTANEKAFSHFEVQRSGNSIEFGYLSTIKAAQMNNYNFIDNSPEKAINYYRLKMVNNDGTFKYSKIIAIDQSENINYIAIENPAQNGEFTVVTDLQNPTLSMYTILANKVEAVVTQIEKNKYVVKIQNYTAGTYILSILCDGKIVTKKVLFP